MSKNIVPNVVRGGIAIPFKNKSNYYYMKGRKHSNGGIDIGKNPRTGLEVEDGEVISTNNNSLKVFSSLPILNGKSPAQRVISGENPNLVFKAQERFKLINGINDDGTKRNNKNINMNRSRKDIGGISWKDVDKFAENAEPYIGGASLAALPLLATPAAPAAGTGLKVLNTVGGIIDAYQAGRHIYKGNYGDATTDAVESLLNFGSNKAIKWFTNKKANKKINNTREQMIDTRRKDYLNKHPHLRRKMGDFNAQEYAYKKAANAVSNSAAANDVFNGIRDKWDKTKRYITTTFDAIRDANDVGKAINKKYGHNINGFTINR